MDKKTKKLVIIAMMMALTELLVWTPIGMIPLPLGLSATIAHLPTIVIAILEGPIAGLIMGLFFGVSALIRAYIAPQGAFDLLFQDPVLSVLPRLFIGVTAYYSYALIQIIGKKINIPKSIPTGIGAFIGSMTNTLLVVGVLVLKYSNMLGDHPIALAGTVIATSGLAEAIVSVIIVTAVVVAVRTVYRKSNN